MGIEFMVKHEVSESFIDDVLTTAVESGGSAYWASIQLVQRKEDLNIIEFQVADTEDLWDEANDPETRDAAHAAGLTIEDFLVESDHWHVVDKDVVIKGIRGILSGIGSDGHAIIHVDDYVRTMVARAVAEDDADIDAIGTDCIVQVGLFDEIVYG